jgi:hypothetical protein
MSVLLQLPSSRSYCYQDQVLCTFATRTKYSVPLLKIKALCSFLTSILSYYYQIQVLGPIVSPVVTRATCCVLIDNAADARTKDCVLLLTMILYCVLLSVLLERASPVSSMEQLQGTGDQTSAAIINITTTCRSVRKS